ncbi:hypothetical protein ACO0SA_002070 [Hanseniaspora valbyensis]
MSSIDSLYLMNQRHTHSHDEHEEGEEACPSTSEYSGNINLRILSIFIILIASAIGVYLPIITSYYRKSAKHPIVKVIFFIARYFGQGVIFATAFIHLLFHANHALTSECLTGVWQEYPFAFAICMGAIFGVYLLEMVTRHYVERFSGIDAGMHGHGHLNSNEILKKDHLKQHDIHTYSSNENATNNKEVTEKQNDTVSDDISSKFEQFNELEKNGSDIDTLDESENTIKKILSYKNQLISVCILEFGVIFHSVFVGLTLGVAAGSEFKTLFCVLVFHQMFEGAAVGTRVVELGKKHMKAQNIFALMFSLTTPISIAIAVGVRHSLSMSSMTANIVTGVFDSISAGILIYNSFELLFMAFNEHRGNIKMKILAYLTTALGVAMMSLLGKWA